MLKQKENICMSKNKKRPTEKTTSERIRRKQVNDAWDDNLEVTKLDKTKIKGRV
jgi:hypothetical protein